MELKPIEAIKDVLACATKDWSLDKNDAWIYGIVAGWDDAALTELQVLHNWSDETVTRLKELHAASNMLNCSHTQTNQTHHCVDCGVRVYGVESRACGGCEFFTLQPAATAIGYCSTLHMLVTKSMCVTYKISVGTCYKPKIK